MTGAPAERRKIRLPRWLLGLGAVAGIAGALFSWSGAIMVGSFAISNPEAEAHWRWLGRVYTVAFVCSLVLLLVSLAAFIRFRRATT